MKRETLRLDATGFTLAMLNVADEEQGRVIWSNTRPEIDLAMHDAQEHLRYRIATGEAPDMDIRFRIRPEPMHQDSTCVQDALGSLKRSGLVQYANGYRHCVFDRYPWPSAEALHSKLLAKDIGPIDIYRPLASRFMVVLSGVEVAPLPALDEA